MNNQKKKSGGNGMISKRIIPCLDVKNGRVVKGVNFEGILFFFKQKTAYEFTV